METLYPKSHVPNSNWFVQETSRSATWTKEENKRFERALAIYADDAPDRWSKVAAMIPGKSVSDVMKQYRALEEDVFDIEAGRVPIPGYLGSSVRFDQLVIGNREFEAHRKRPNGTRGSDQERKKGVPWTEDEHRRFLLGLLKYGKGDWRNISRNFVLSKTPTQVASHAQKYYQRQLSGGKDKRRPSIHDITTVNLLNANLSDNHSRPFDHPSTSLLSTQQKPDLGFISSAAEELIVLNQNLSDSNLIISSSSYDSTLKGTKFMRDNAYGSRNPVF